MLKMQLIAHSSIEDGLKLALREAGACVSARQEEKSCTWSAGFFAAGAGVVSSISWSNSLSMVRISVLICA